jgi:hypothetical protein
MEFLLSQGNGNLPVDVIFALLMNRQSIEIFRLVGTYSTNVCLRYYDCNILSTGFLKVLEMDYLKGAMTSHPMEETFQHEMGFPVL